MLVFHCSLFYWLCSTNKVTCILSTLLLKHVNINSCFNIFWSKIRLFPLFKTLTLAYNVTSFLTGTWSQVNIVHIFKFLSGLTITHVIPIIVLIMWTVVNYLNWLENLQDIKWWTYLLYPIFSNGIASFL